MGTTHNHDLPAATTVALTDQVPTINTATGRGAYATLGQIASTSKEVVATTATALTITAALHANRIVRISSTAPIIVTLPAATGTGNIYRFVMGVAATATESTIKVANATDVMTGVVWAATTTSDNAEAFIATATSDSIEMNGTTKGGVVGDMYQLIYVATGVWNVQGFTASTGTVATPFDATVS